MNINKNFVGVTYQKKLVSVSENHKHLLTTYNFSRKIFKETNASKFPQIVHLSQNFQYFKNIFI